MGDQAIALGWLVGYFEDRHAESWEGWVYALCVVVATMTFKYVAFVQRAMSSTVLYVFRSGVSFCTSIVENRPRNRVTLCNGSHTKATADVM